MPVIPVCQPVVRPDQTKTKRIGPDPKRNGGGHAGNAERNGFDES